MSLSLLVRKAAILSGVGFAAWAALGQASFLPQAGEFAPLGILPGDQVRPQLSINTTGGFLVWEDNVTDGDGFGIRAVKLDSGFAAPFAPFRVNSIGAGDQDHAQVTLLKNGGAAFVWQGGRRGAQHIWGRFLSPTNTWLAADVQVNASTSTNSFQASPSLACLGDGNVIVTYGSFNQFSSTSYQDVYAQRFSPTGQKLGGEFLVNQFTAYNQRTPSVAALSDGRLVIAWVSEQQRFDNSVDIFARLFNRDGTAAGGEFLVNTSTNVCANPCVAAAGGGGFTVVWGEKDLVVFTNSWDVFARTFTGAGAGGTVSRLNDFVFGDQFAPKIATLANGSLVTWTSLEQDGSAEGVYGRFLDAAGRLAGTEFRVNTSTISRQIHPTVAADGSGRFLAVWSGFVSSANGMDLYGQRYVNDAQPLVAMNAPFVYVPFTFAQVGTASVYEPQLQVSWAPRGDVAVDHYNVYLNGSTTPALSTSSNVCVLTGLATSTSYSVQVDYVAVDGRQAPISPATTASTWSGYSWGGIPFEWVAFYYGGMGNMFNWPNPNLPVTAGGPTLLQVYLSGANPLDSTTWLRVVLTPTSGGYYVNWNPQPGLVYQVQSSPDMISWTSLDAPHFAAGSSDSLFVGHNNTAYYRVLRLR